MPAVAIGAKELVTSWLFYEYGWMGFNIFATLQLLYLVTTREDLYFRVQLALVYFKLHCVFPLWLGDVAPQEI